ncbi:MAG: succinate dehydrogenase assembly factor 2 [Alphaproteobacteria bacterium]
MADTQSGAEPREIRIRRMRFRAWHRGMQEADLVYGRFADKHLETMTDEELAQFDILLELLDQDVLDWIFERQPVPAAYDWPLTRAMLAFDATDMLKK